MVGKGQLQVVKHKRKWLVQVHRFIRAAALLCSFPWLLIRAVQSTASEPASMVIDMQPAFFNPEHNPAFCASMRIFMDSLCGEPPRPKPEEIRAIFFSSWLPPRMKVI